MQNIPWKDRKDFYVTFIDLQLIEQIEYFKNKHYLTFMVKNNSHNKIENQANQINMIRLEKAILDLSIYNERLGKNSLVSATLMTIQTLFTYFNSKDSSECKESKEARQDKEYNILLIDNNNIISSFLALKNIQIVNLIIDDLKKTKKLSQNMFEIADGINFPQYIVELRHQCTHKFTPNLDLLVKGFIDILEFLYSRFWIKTNEIFRLKDKKVISVKEIISSHININEKNKNNRSDYINKLNKANSDLNKKVTKMKINKILKNSNEHMKSNLDVRDYQEILEYIIHLKADIQEIVGDESINKIKEVNSICENEIKLNEDGQQEKFKYINSNNESKNNLKKGTLSIKKGISVLINLKEDNFKDKLTILSTLLQITEKIINVDCKNHENKNKLNSADDFILNQLLSSISEVIKILSKKILRINCFSDLKLTNFLNCQEFTDYWSINKEIYLNLVRLLNNKSDIQDEEDIRVTKIQFIRILNWCNKQ